MYRKHEYYSQIRVKAVAFLSTALVRRPLIQKLIHRVSPPPKNKTLKFVNKINEKGLRTHTLMFFFLQYNPDSKNGEGPTWPLQGLKWGPGLAAWRGPALA